MPVQLVITLTDEGQLNVSGPIDNKMLCYGILEVAKEVVAERARQSQKLVQPATMVLPKIG